jgi:hypothetical protein
MKGLKIVTLITIVSWFIASSLYADIYRWTDENGVIHFANYAPPDGATIMMKTEELPYDEAADRERMEAERQRQLELARLEIAEKEAEIERRAAEAERRAAEADRYAEETLREADNYLEAARNDRYYNRSFGFFGFSRPRHFNRWYYRNETASIYYRRPHYRHPYKHRFQKRHFYGHSRKYYRHKYYQKKHSYRKG